MKRIVIGSLAFLGLVGMGCGLISFTVKPESVIAEFESNSSTGGGCIDSGKPFGAAVIVPKDLLKGSNYDTSSGCFDALHVSVSQVGVDILEDSHKGDMCGGPKGTATLDSYQLSYDYNDGGAKTETITIPCTDKSVSLDSQQVISTKAQACMDLINSSADFQEKIRTAFNRHPDKISINAVGSCTADSCFYMKSRVKLRLDCAVAKAGGPCSATNKGCTPQ